METNLTQEAITDINDLVVGTIYSLSTSSKKIELEGHNEVMVGGFVLDENLNRTTHFDGVEVSLMFPFKAGELTPYKLI